MQYSKEFQELIKECKKNDQYVGLGNPDAKILIIGKEAGIPIGTKLHEGSAQSWATDDYSQRYKPSDKLKNGKHTWQQYQKLYNLILEKLSIDDIAAQDSPYEITFVENVFTTELSNLPALNTKKAKKQEGFKDQLKERKMSFFKSKFIQNFPIVIITASDNKYIETHEGEVCKLFNVSFSENIAVGEGNQMWVHYSEKGKNKTFPKLVIHTRQLTNGASNELLMQITDTVAGFIKKYDIKIKVK